MTRIKRFPVFVTAVIVAGLASTSGGVKEATASQTEELQPELRHSQISRLVTDFIEKSHYSKVRVDDELSSTVFDNYLDALDGNRSYFLQSDIKEFEKFRFRLDNAVHGTYSLEPVFDIFERYTQRARTQLELAITLLEEEPDFTLTESFQFDREGANWPENEAELNELWRKYVKNDALEEVLDDEPWEATREKLTKQYKRRMKRYDEVNSDEVFETFMNAYAHTIDPHSSYFSPRNSEEYRIQMKLSYFGIGASLLPDDDYVKVVKVIAGGPAAIDGSLRPDDYIVGVGQGENDEIVDVVGWHINDVVDLIRGEAGTTVRLEILPKGALPGSDRRELSLVRNQVKLEESAAKSEIKTIDREGRDFRVGVITVPSFYRDYEAQQSGDPEFRSTARDVRKIIDKLEAEGIDGIVMDLRNNGGGHLSEATALSGLFINNGPLVQLRNTLGKVEVLRDPVPQVAYSGPLTVLVNRFSASASEIFAAAIQDYERGVVIGQQTFGKGSVQNLYALDQYFKPPEGESFGQLTLTIGKYYRVTGESTQHRGVTPDIALPSTIDEEVVGESTRDSALPWDQINGTRYRADSSLDTLIDKLSNGFERRLIDDPDLEHLVSNIQALEEMRSKKSVSLNLETRQSERERLKAARLARENVRRVALGLDPLESLDEDDDETEGDDDGDDKHPDVLLEEAAAITADMAILRLRAVPDVRATAQLGNRPDT